MFFFFFSNSALSLRRARLSSLVPRNEEHRLRSERRSGDRAAETLVASPGRSGWLADSGRAEPAGNGGAGGVGRSQEFTFLFKDE